MPRYEPPIEFLLEVGELVREIMESDVVVDLAFEEELDAPVAGPSGVPAGG